MTGTRQAAVAAASHSAPRASVVYGVSIHVRGSVEFQLLRFIVDAEAARGLQQVIPDAGVAGS